MKFTEKLRNAVFPKYYLAHNHNFNPVKFQVLNDDGMVLFSSEKYEETKIIYDAYMSIGKKECYEVQ
jgi:hypothetical protein